MESLRVRLATDAARYLALCVTPCTVSLEFGARRFAGETRSGQRLGEADDRVSTGLPKIAGLQRRHNSGNIVTSQCGKNPLTLKQKQRTCGRKKCLSRITPLQGFSGVRWCLARCYGRAETV